MKIPSGPQNPRPSQSPQPGNAYHIDPPDGAVAKPENTPSPQRATGAGTASQPPEGASSQTRSTLDEKTAPEATLEDSFLRPPADRFKLPLLSGANPPRPNWLNASGKTSSFHAGGSLPPLDQSIELPRWTPHRPLEFKPRPTFSDHVDVVINKSLQDFSYRAARDPRYRRLRWEPDSITPEFPLKDLGKITLRNAGKALSAEAKTWSIVQSAESKANHFLDWAQGLFQRSENLDNRNLYNMPVAPDGPALFTGGDWGLHARLKGETVRAGLGYEYKLGQHTRFEIQTMANWNREEGITDHLARVRFDHWSEPNNNQYYRLSLRADHAFEAERTDFFLSFEASF